MAHSAALHLAPEPVTATSVLALVRSIEARPASAPAAAAFRSALARKGREADAVGGVQVLDGLLREVALADPSRAVSRTAILRSAWADLMPGPGGRARA